MSIFYSSQLNRIEKELKIMSTALADLQASVANITTMAANAITLLNQLFATVQAGGTINPADIEAQVTAINAEAASLGVAVTADTPPVVPPAAPKPASRKP
jgi:hypothetical protein